MKKKLYEFNGFKRGHNSATEHAKKRDLLLSLSKKSLVNICSLADLNSVGNKTEIVEKILQFLTKPF